MQAEDAVHLSVYPKPPLAIVSGDGCWLQDAEGRRYLDLYGGHCVSLLGHGHAGLTRAVQDQAARLLFVSNAVYNDARAAALSALAGLAPAGLRRAFLCNSGTEANETALKIARRHTGRRRVVSMQQGFHGRTLGSLGVTGPDGYRHPTWPVDEAEHVRIPYGDEAALAAAVDARTAAVITEPLTSLGGIALAPPSWFAALRRVCDAHGALLVFDEVQTGLGRTGTPFFGEQVGVVPDLITLAKGLAGGVPAGAVLVRETVAAGIGNGEQGSTFGGGPLACAAIAAVVRALRDEGLIARAGRLGERVQRQLAAVPGVLGVPGRGLLLGIDLDRPAAPVVAALRARGLLVGTSRPPNQLRLLPPLVIAEDELDLFVRTLAEVLAEDAGAAGTRAATGSATSAATGGAGGAAPGPAPAASARGASAPGGAPAQAPVAAVAHSPAPGLGAAVPGAPVAPASPAAGAASSLASRHLLSLAGLPSADWNALLADAERLSGPAGKRPLLAGRRLGLLLLNPSLRTRLSFEVACADLGASSHLLQPGAGLWALEHRDGVVMDGEAAEHVKEALAVLAGMVEALGVRAFAGLRDAAEDASEPFLSALATHATIPLLNLESANDHPHQGLADALVLRRRFPGRRVRVVLRWAPHVKPLPRAVPHAALLAFAHEGHAITVAHPPGYDLDPAVLAAARALAAGNGGRVDVTHDFDAAQQGAEVLYVKAWGSVAHYGDPRAAAADLAARRDGMVTARDLAAGPALFMHCLPVRRNVVVADEVLDGPHSLVASQAAARLPVQKAALCRAFGVRP